MAEKVSQRDIAAAVSRMIGAGDRTESFTLEQMYGLGGPPPSASRSTSASPPIMRPTWLDSEPH